MSEMPKFYEEAATWTLRFRDHDSVHTFTLFKIPSTH